MFSIPLSPETFASRVDDALGWEGIVVLVTEGLGEGYGQYGGEYGGGEVGLCGVGVLDLSGDGATMHPGVIIFTLNLLGVPHITIGGISNKGYRTELAGSYPSNISTCAG